MSVAAPRARARPGAGAWAAAVLLPPLGLHLAGAPPRDFWMGTGLTLLGFVPGAVFALGRLILPSQDAAAAR